MISLCMAQQQRSSTRVRYWPAPWPPASGSLVAWIRPLDTRLPVKPAHKLLERIYGTGTRPARPVAGEPCGPARRFHVTITRAFIGFPKRNRLFARQLAFVLDFCLFLTALLIGLNVPFVQDDFGFDHTQSVAVVANGRNHGLFSTFP